MSSAPVANVKILREGARLPEFMSAGAAGADLRACLESPVVIFPGKRALVPTGIALEIPVGYEGEIRPRSGLAAKHGITLVNSPGTIDSDYRGEVQVIMINLGGEPFKIENGDRIAQILINRVEIPEYRIVDELSETHRDEGGFGSSGR
jgi:dUTP pyrophosphatase